MNKSPYEIIKSIYVSEKANMLGNLKEAESNICLKRFKKPKYVFLVDMTANKCEIKKCIEYIYKKDNVKVESINTIIGKTKPRFFKGRRGRTKPYKKAIVTFREGDEIQEQK